MNNGFLFIFFGFGTGFGFGEFSFVRKRNIAFHRTIIQRVNSAFFQIAEQSEHINGSTDTEPEGGNKCHNPRYQQSCDKEVMPPPLDRPRCYTVPDYHQNECQSKFIYEAVNKYAPGNDPV